MEQKNMHIWWNKVQCQGPKNENLNSTISNIYNSEFIFLSGNIIEEFMFGTNISY